MSAPQSGPQPANVPTPPPSAHKPLCARTERCAQGLFAIPKERLAQIWAEAGRPWPPTRILNLLCGDFEPQARDPEVQAECEQLLSRLFLKSTRQGWSGRKLASEIGMAESSLRALAKGARAPDYWMPALRSAVQRLGA